MPVKNSNRRIVIIILFFLAHATILTLLGLGSAVAYARIPPTDTPTGLADLNGRVDLQGRLAYDRPAISWIIPITVGFFPVNGGTPFTVETSTDQNGEFIIKDIEPGTYNIRVKGFNTLGNLVRNVILQPGDNFQNFHILLSGDVEQANSWNVLAFEHDLITILGAQGKCLGQPGYDPIFDLEVNNCINGGDVGILLSNAPPGWDPNNPRIGDIDVTDDVVGPILTIASGSSATAEFDPSEETVQVGEVTTISVKVTPCCPTEINYVHFTLGFSPTPLQVNNVVSNQLPIVMSKTIDNNQGIVHFQVGIAGITFTDTVTVAELSIKVLTNTNSIVISPTQIFVGGPGGTVPSVFTQSMTIKSGNCSGGYCYYFPVILKDSSS